jgi:hypothetical protein
VSDDAENPPSSRSFEVKRPEVKFKVAHTPNFGKKEDWLPKKEHISQVSSAGTSSRRSSSRHKPELQESLCTFGSKYRVPQLPLESLLEESTEQRTLNLSTINYSLDTDKESAVDQDASTDTCCIRNTFQVCKSNESEELLGYLGQEVNGTLLLSPVMHQKAFSRLDESSMVDPLSNILVDKTTETSNKQNVQRSILRREPEAPKSQLYIDAKLLELMNLSKAEYTDLKSRVKTVARELRTVRSAEAAVPDKLKSQLQETMREALDSFKQNFIQEKRAELVELVTREIAKHIGSEDSRKVSNLKREYEDRVHLNQEYIDRLKKQNHSLKSQLEERREPSLDKYRALVSENLRLKEELTTLKHRVEGNSCGCRGQ